MALKINKSIRATRVGWRRPLSAIKAVVFHFTANTGTSATALGNARYFANGSDGRAASAHYVVDESDTVYECVPPEVVAWAVGDGQSGKYGKVYGNYNTISIEMVSHTDPTGTYYIPAATMRNAALLYQQLCKQIPSIQAAIRHYDISMKLCPLPLVDEKKWADFQQLLKEVDEVVTKAKMIVDGKEVEVERILKDGTNYVKIRDIAKALDLDVSNKGNVAILNHKGG